MALMRTFAIFILLSTIMKYTVDSHLTSFIGISHRECVNECHKRRSCKSLTYKRLATFCQLYDDFVLEYKGKRNKGLEYADVDITPELSFIGECDGIICLEGQLCDTTCKIMECLPPVIFPDTVIHGNMRTIGSTIAYQCEQLGTLHFSTCQINGQWSLTDHFCSQLGVTFYGVNIFMPSFSAGRYYNATVKFDNVTRDQCLQLCNADNAFCIAFNYNRENGSCILSDLQLNSNTHVEPIPAPGWELYNKVLPISHHNKNGVRYQFTYAEAETYCKSMNTTIATLADIEQAFNLGYNLCTCGWIKDDYAIAVLHYVFYKCFKHRTGMIPCDWAGVFDVYCKNPNF